MLIFGRFAPAPISMLVGNYQAKGRGVLTEFISQFRYSVLGITSKEVVWGRAAEEKIDRLKALSRQSRRC